MSALQTKTGDIPKRRGFRFWVGCFTLLLGLPIWLYYAYCWGIWGRNSLLLQYLLQCECSASSEEARYPGQVDIIVPACRMVNTGVRLLPSGRFLYLREEKNGLAVAYLLDLQTMQRMKVTDQPFLSFLTDDLWFVDGGVNSYIIDRTTGTQYPITTFRHWQENSYVNRAPNVELLVSALHQATQVFLTPNYSTVVVLRSNFFANPEQGFTFENSDFPEWGPRRIEQFLQENNIVYQTVLADFPHEVKSPDGRFIARDDGIYLAESNQMIVIAPPSLVRGWIYDSRGAIYASVSKCLLQIKFPYSDDASCFRRVPQPVIKLNVPEKYLPSTQMQ